MSACETASTVYCWWKVKPGAPYRSWIIRVSSELPQLIMIGTFGVSKSFE
jgi:hypothetical protein